MSFRFDFPHDSHVDHSLKGGLPEKNHPNFPSGSKVKLIASLHMIRQERSSTRVKFSSVPGIKMPQDLNEFKKINEVKAKILKGSLSKVYNDDSLLLRIPFVEFVMRLLGYESFEKVVSITKDFLQQVAFKGIVQDSPQNLEKGLKILSGLEQTADGRRVLAKLKEDLDFYAVHDALFYLFAIQHTHREHNYNKFAVSRASLRLALEIETHRLTNGQSAAFGEIAKILKQLSESTQGKDLLKELLREQRFSDLLKFYFASASKDVLRRHQSENPHDKIELWARARDLFNLKNLYEFEGKQTLEPIFQELFRVPAVTSATHEMEVQTKEYLEKIEKNLLFLRDPSFIRCFDVADRPLFKRMRDSYFKHASAFKALSHAFLEEGDSLRRAHAAAKAYTSGKDLQEYLKTAAQLIQISGQASKAFTCAIREGRIAKWYLGPKQAKLRQSAYRFFANGPVDPQSLELSLIVMQRLAKIPLQLAELKRQFSQDEKLGEELNTAIAHLRKEIARINANLPNSDLKGY